jgi:hypothetical protein
MPHHYFETMRRMASRHFSISHFGVLVAPQMPTVSMFFSHEESISTALSM